MPGLYEAHKSNLCPICNQNFSDLTIVGHTEICLANSNKTATSSSVPNATKTNTNTIPNPNPNVSQQQATKKQKVSRKTSGSANVTVHNLNKMWGHTHHKPLWATNKREGNMVNENTKNRASVSRDEIINLQISQHDEINVVYNTIDTFDTFEAIDDQDMYDLQQEEKYDDDERPSTPLSESSKSPIKLSEKIQNWKNYKPPPLEVSEIMKISTTTNDAASMMVSRTDDVGSLIGLGPTGESSRSLAIQVAENASNLSKREFIYNSLNSNVNNNNKDTTSIDTNTDNDLNGFVNSIVYNLDLCGTPFSIGNIINTINNYDVSSPTVQNVSDSININNTNTAIESSSSSGSSNNVDGNPTKSIILVCAVDKTNLLRVYSTEEACVHAIKTNNHLSNKSGNGIDGMVGRLQCGTELRMIKRSCNQGIHIVKVRLRSGTIELGWIYDDTSVLCALREAEDRECMYDGEGDLAMLPIITPPSSPPVHRQQKQQPITITDNWDIVEIVPEAPTGDACPICNQIMPTDKNLVTQHIEMCLRMMEAEQGW